jgi:hypothetical protein
MTLQTGGQTGPPAAIPAGSLAAARPQPGIRQVWIAFSSSSGARRSSSPSGVGGDRRAAAQGEMVDELERQEG